VLLKYPRLQGRELDKFQLSVANADEQTLSRFKSFEVNQVHECLTFLNSLFLPYWGAPHHKLQKCLLVALILQGRLAVISKKADTLTTAFMRNSDIVKVAKGLVVTVCNQWSDAEQLKNAIVSSPVLKKEVVKSLRMKMQELEVCCPRKLQQRLRNL
jgi:hypothetical protein